jgi:hypothetical protein
LGNFVLQKNSVNLNNINQNQFMKGFLIILIMLYCHVAIAQLRLSVLGGPALSATDKKQDTTFFSDKGNSQVVKLGYHKGRLGLVLNGSFIQQKPGNVIADGRTGKILVDTTQQTGGISDVKYSFTGGNVTTTVMSFTPQVCFPIGKIKLNVYAGGGMAFIKAAPTTILSQILTAPPKDFYTNTLNKSTSPVFQSGLTLQIPLLKKLLLDVNGDYLSYKISVLNKEKRNNFQPTEIESQKKLFNIRGGLTYKF